MSLIIFWLCCGLINKYMVNHKVFDELYVIISFISSNWFRDCLFDYLIIWVWLSINIYATCELGKLPTIVYKMPLRCEFFRKFSCFWYSLAYLWLVTLNPLSLHTYLYCCFCSWERWVLFICELYLYQVFSRIYSSYLL